MFGHHMADRIEKKEFVRRVAARMGSDEAQAAAWVDGILEEMPLTRAFARGTRTCVCGARASHAPPAAPPQRRARTA